MLDGLLYIGMIFSRKKAFGRQPILECSIILLEDRVITSPDMLSALLDFFILPCQFF